MSDSGREITEKVKESIVFMKEATLMEIGVRVNVMDKEGNILVRITTTKEVGRMIRNMGLVGSPR